MVDGPGSAGTVKLKGRHLFSNHIQMELRKAWLIFFVMFIIDMV